MIWFDDLVTMMLLTIAYVCHVCLCRLISISFSGGGVGHVSWQRAAGFFRLLVWFLCLPWLLVGSVEVGVAKPNLFFMISSPNQVPTKRNHCQTKSYLSQACFENTHWDLTQWLANGPNGYRWYHLRPCQTLMMQADRQIGLVLFCNQVSGLSIARNIMKPIFLFFF